MKNEVEAALNEMIQHEHNNAHVYRGVALYFESLNLHGLAAWMTKQVGDERAHGEKFIKHLMDRGGKVALGAVAAAETGFANPLAAVKAVLALEQSTTRNVHRLYELARKVGDYALEIELHWFITEQVEEEQWAGELTSQMELFHKSAGQLYMLDHTWGKRAKGG